MDDIKHIPLRTRVIYKKRIAEIIGIRRGVKLDDYKHTLTPSSGLHFDLRMFDSDFVFKDVHCSFCEPVDVDFEGGYLRLVKA